MHIRTELLHKRTRRVEEARQNMRGMITWLKVCRRLTQMPNLHKRFHGRLLDGIGKCGESIANKDQGELSNISVTGKLARTRGSFRYIRARYFVHQPFVTSVFPLDLRICQITIFAFFHKCKLVPLELELVLTHSLPVPLSTFLVFLSLLRAQYHHPKCGFTNIYQHDVFSLPKTLGNHVTTRLECIHIPCRRLPRPNAPPSVTKTEISSSRLPRR